MAPSSLPPHSWQQSGAHSPRWLSRFEDALLDRTECLTAGAWSDRVDYDYLARWFGKPGLWIFRCFRPDPPGVVPGEEGGMP